MSVRLSVFAVPGIPLVKPGDDIAGFIVDGIAAMGETLAGGDVVVVAQKIVSKAEGRLVALSTVTPSERALELAGITGKDPRVVELVLRESSEVLRARTNVLVVEPRYADPVSLVHYKKVLVTKGAIDKLKEMFA